MLTDDVVRTLDTDGVLKMIFPGGPAGYEFSPPQVTRTLVSATSLKVAIELVSGNREPAYEVTVQTKPGSRIGADRQSPKGDRAAWRRTPRRPPLAANEPTSVNHAMVAGRTEVASGLMSCCRNGIRTSFAMAMTDLLTPSAAA